MNKSVAEQIKDTKALLATLENIIDDVEWLVNSLEQIDEEKRSDADNRVLRYAKHLQKYYN